MARSHQLISQGYKVMFDENLVTVWSAPNCCYRLGNKAAVMLADGGSVWRFKVFASVSSKDKIKHYKNVIPVFTA